MRKLADSLPIDYWRLRSLAYREYCNKRALPAKLIGIFLITGDKQFLNRIPSLILVAKYAYKARINSIMMAAEKMIRRKLIYLKER